MGGNGWALAPDQSGACRLVVDSHMAMQTIIVVVAMAAISSA